MVEAYLEGSSSCNLQSVVVDENLLWDPVKVSEQDIFLPLAVDCNALCLTILVGSRSFEIMERHRESDTVALCVRSI